MDDLLSVQFVSAQDLYKEVDEEDTDDNINMEVRDNLASHIIKIFQINKSEKQNSGIEDKCFDAVRAYNGQYSPEELDKIRLYGGSEIFMDLTATKSRAAQSWIRDILLSANQDAFSIEKTPLPSLPSGVEEKINQAYARDFVNKADEQSSEGPVPLETANNLILEEAQNIRDIREAILEEINLQASFELKILELRIKDQLVEGGWREALSDFIEDFCVFPTAFMKGPIITKSKKLEWVDGSPQIKEDYCFVNKRISPFDVYPSPSATSIEDGDFIEHVRLSRVELDELKAIGSDGGYDVEKIKNILEKGPQCSWLDSGIEYEKQEVESRGSMVFSDGQYHGLHFWGYVDTEKLKEWGVDTLEVLMQPDDTKLWNVEALLVNNEVIKCKLNVDPLNRRPYYKASYQNIPGSFWGRSLPDLMRDIQRMCNACARELSNNMALSSGPQCEVYIDRLADSGPLEQMRPRTIWQLRSDPSSGQGRGINFFTVPSIANELLAVYEKFELKADDATGIPRYSYGNERVGGAAQTASGLSMLLESATKSIKDAIRHIDAGLIKPRVEYQFYWNLKKNPSGYSGDINIITHGSEAITMRGTQQMKRQEFLQTTANEMDQRLMGPEGRAELIREMAKDLGLSTKIVPTRLELKRLKKESQQQEAQRAADEAQGKTVGSETGFKIAQLQAQVTDLINQRNTEIKLLENQRKSQEHVDKMALENKRIEVSRDNATTKVLADVNKHESNASLQKELQNQKLAFEAVSTNDQNTESR